MAATLQRKSSGGIIFVIITKIITKQIVPGNYFVIISARMVVSHYSAIGDTISCDAPYRVIGFRGKIFLRYPLVRSVFGLR